MTSDIPSPAGGPVTTADPLAGRPGPDDAVLELLRQWAPHQRWFPAKGTTSDVHALAVIPLPDPAGEAVVEVHLVRLGSGGVLQVPLVLRADDGRDRPGLIGTVEQAPTTEAVDDGAATVRTAVLDGCQDPAFVRAWLAAAADDTGARPADPVATVTDMRVLGGEQSNTSVLLPSGDPPAILKVFRGVPSGASPDVDVPLALSRVGWRGVPRPLAWLTGSWTGQGDDGAPVTEVAHLGVLAELVVGAQDGFELACRYARDGEDFGGLAHDLGRTTAQMHDALRRALPVDDRIAGDRAAEARRARVVDALRRRAAAAVEAAPVLQERAARIEEVLAAVEELPDVPAVQRVHGDYHLGQVLHSADRGWSVLDFEGEPQASAAERTRPDLALRDLAGMLRSIDYAAAVGHASTADWATGARSRLVEGYLSEAGAPDSGTSGTSPELLRALELDKALYEVVYESRNRPTWLHIPLDGVDRLLPGDR